MKLRILIVLVIMASLFITSCKNEDNGVPVTGIALSSPADTIIIGNMINLTATIVPGNADNQTIIWTTSNSEIAEVDIIGRVKALAVGNVVITATTEDGNKISTVNIICKKADALTMKMGETISGTERDYISDGGSSWINASLVTASASFMAEQIWAQIEGNTAGFKCAIYSDKNGVPDLLLGQTEELTNTVTGWTKFKLKEKVAITAGKSYWLGITSNYADKAYVYYRTNAGSLYWGLYDYATSYPASFASTTDAGGSSTAHYCMYVWGKVAE